MALRHILAGATAVAMLVAAPGAFAQSGGSTNTDSTTLAGGKNGQQGQSMQKKEGAAESSGASMSKSDGMKGESSGSMSK